MPADCLLKTKKEFKNSKRQEIQAIYTKINSISLFSTWHVLWRFYKDLTRRTASDKVLRDKAFNIAKTPKYDKYQRGLASVVYKFFNK